MSVPLTEAEVRPLAPLVEILALLTGSAASSWGLFALDLPDVVDPLQEFAERTGLVAAIGQDAVQAIINAPFAWLRGECEPVPNDYAAQLLRQWELADPRDAWRHSGELPPPEDVRNSDISGKQAKNPRPHGPPQATIDAFRYVVSLGDAEYLANWLRDHSDVAPALIEHLEAA